MNGHLKRRQGLACLALLASALGAGPGCGHSSDSGVPAQAGSGSSGAGSGGEPPDTLDSAGAGGQSGAPEAPQEGEAGASGSPSDSAAGTGGALDAAGAAGMAGAPSDETPTLTLLGATTLVLDCGASYSEPGATAVDAEDGALEVSIAGADIDTSKPGQFAVQYQATDSATHRAVATRSVLVCGPTCADLGKEAIDLSPWSKIQYELKSQPDANWTLSNGGFNAKQSVNADASILLSDFDTTDLSIEGTWTMLSSSDDDFVGFVFGYRDRGHYYLFDWKGATQDYPNSGDTALVGMSLKVVNVPQDPVYADLWNSVGTLNVKPLEQQGAPLHNSVAWQKNVEYHFFLEFHAGSFRIDVRDPLGASLQSWSVNDATYASGAFGFYNFSQAPVNYASFKKRAVPPACSTVAPPPTP